MKGRILKGIAGFYYVHTEESGTWECKARGVFRMEGQKPLVGDEVEIELLDRAEKTGNILRILPRRSELIRPAVANVDQALVIFAAAKPKPNLSLLDRFLIQMSMQGIRTLICFNKKDEAAGEELSRLSGIYAGCGCPVLFTNAKSGEGVEQLRERLLGHTTTVAGPSGVGKSTLINRLAPEAAMETGSISEKIGRGRHTTRHSELFRIEEGSYIFDTPGFSSLSPGEMKKEELKGHFPEFRAYEGACRFQGCMHRREPGCMVKEAVQAGKICRERYESYLCLFEEIQEREKRRYS